MKGQQLLQQSLIATDAAKDILQKGELNVGQLEEAFRHLTLASAKLNKLIGTVKGQHVESKSSE